MDHEPRNGHPVLTFGRAPGAQPVPHIRLIPYGATSGADFGWPDWSACVPSGRFGRGAMQQRRYSVGNSVGAQAGARRVGARHRRRPRFRRRCAARSARGPSSGDGDPSEDDRSGVDLLRPRGELALGGAGA